jgi:hypothetical protein
MLVVTESEREKHGDGEILMSGRPLASRREEHRECYRLSCGDHSKANHPAIPQEAAARSSRRHGDKFSWPKLATQR